VQEITMAGSVSRSSADRNDSSAILTDAVPVDPLSPTYWILRVSESRTNYWATYVVDTSLMLWFLAWDAFRLHVHALPMLACAVAGAFTWTFTEYTFHRWMYHMGLSLTTNAHEKHHDDPTAYIAMPFFITPLIFLPPQWLLAGWLHLAGVSSFLAGWLGGFIAYSYLHHSLHHHKLPFAWFRHLQSAHRIHHALPETNFGVTVRFWDRVFGTAFTKPPRPPAA
jgi:sterol desaturase/sphingolipid hydroxylase (fatty acid hydroxylase superfamily)